MVRSYILDVDLKSKETGILEERCGGRLFDRLEEKECEIWSKVFLLRLRPLQGISCETEDSPATGTNCAMRWSRHVKESEGGNSRNFVGLSGFIRQILMVCARWALPFSGPGVRFVLGRFIRR
jgi:hypothetical protein